ncbi:MAG: HAMP domain-containing histidine kinase [Anaerolineae bacterium]|jgi:two-component system OmpR family sensor kinase/two-component system sensor histidine kinase BaeS|nr:HAMP domain-containing histidine kinase [Anaerolineae bacterium]
MNRLWVRLSLIVVLLNALSVLMIALITNAEVNREFERYLNLRDQAETPSTSVPPGRPPPPRNREREREFLVRFQTSLIVAGVLGSGISIAIGILISRMIARPLHTLAEAARAFERHEWDHRVGLHGTIEVKNVAHAFNAMADEIQHAEQLRRSLIADIAHELRTPLTVMQGNLRAMLDGVYPMELKEVASIYDETRLLSRLVRDLHELALAEAGKLPLNLQPVDVQALVQHTVERFSIAAEDQQTAIAYDLMTPLPTVRADPDRLAQVLHNLIGNALRHTKGGQVRISGQGDERTLMISVIDTGEGIAPEDLGRIFERFYRADPSRTRTTGGSGLGLAIAKSWIEAMGGQIGVESQPGVGSRFWFTLRTSGA